MRRTLWWGVGGGAMVLMCMGQGCPGFSRLGNPTGSNNNTPSSTNQKSILPDELTLDTSEFPEDSTDPNAKSVNPLIAGNGRYCALGHTVHHRFHLLLDRALAIGAKLNQDVLSSNGGSQLAGTLSVGNRSIPYKADFSAFDIDGDGTADGSGQLDTEPVALRLWVDTNGDGQYSPFVCALITTRPSASNVGAGQMYVHPGLLVTESAPDVHIYVKWDRTDPSHKWDEGFTNGVLRADYHVTGGHVRVDVNTLADNSVQKTLRSTTSFSGNRFGVSEFDYAARTLKDLGYALVNAKATGGGLEAETNRCVSLENCALSATGCSTIDPTGMDFLTPATGAETDFPVAFPSTPTF